MAKSTNYDKEIRKLQAEIRKRRKLHRKRSHLLEKVEKLKRAKKKAEKKKKRVVPKKKVAKKKRTAPKKKVAKKKRTAPKKKVAKKKRTAPKKKKKRPLPELIISPEYEEPEEEFILPAPVTKRIPFIDIESGTEEMFLEPGIPRSGDHYMNSSHANRKEMSGITIGGVERVADVFEKAFERALSKGPFEADEVNIFQYGVILRPRIAQEITEDVREKLSEILKDVPGAVVHIVDEHGTHSIRVGIGNAREVSNAEKVSDELRRNSENFDRMLDYLESVYDDVDWFSFWDTEESMYE